MQLLHQKKVSSDSNFRGSRYILWFYFLTSKNFEITFEAIKYVWCAHEKVKTVCLLDDMVSGIDVEKLGVSGNSIWRHLLPTLREKQNSFTFTPACLEPVRQATVAFANDSLGAWTNLTNYHFNPFPLHPQESLLHLPVEFCFVDHEEFQQR